MSVLGLGYRGRGTGKNLRLRIAFRQQKFRLPHQSLPQEWTSTIAACAAPRQFFSVHWVRSGLREGWDSFLRQLVCPVALATGQHKGSIYTFLANEE